MFDTLRRLLQPLLSGHKQPTPVPGDHLPPSVPKAKEEKRPGKKSKQQVESEPAAKPPLKPLINEPKVPGTTNEHWQTNKHGLPVLDTIDDLQTLFEGGLDPKTAGDFATLFEEEDVESALPAIVREKEPADPGRRGRPGSEKVAPQVELDLHGHTAQKAEDRTESFILSAAGHGLQCVRIITGKGLHSEGPAVLPAVVEGKLCELQRKKIVRAFQPEKRSGGSIVVFLR